MHGLLNAYHLPEAQSVVLMPGGEALPKQDPAMVVGRPPLTQPLDHTLG